MDITTIGQQLQQIRKSLHYTRGMLADMAHFSVSKLRGIEMGTRDHLMPRILEYLAPCGYNIIMYYGDNSIVIEEYAQIPALFNTLCQERGIERESLKEQLGCYIVTVNKKLDNISPMRESMFCQLCAILDVKVEFAPINKTDK